MLQKAFTTAFDTALFLSSLLSPSPPHQQCRLLPGDPTWPTLAEWNALNASVDGRLIKPTPIGAPCHHPTYDEEACEVVRKNWRNPAFHELHPSSVMDPIFLNKTCDPFTDPNTPCLNGPYVEYVVNVTEPHHVSRALEFAKENGVRFVVKNTGHDYMGRSTGAGALSVWTHHLKGVEVIDSYETRNPATPYKGAAVKVSAGVTGGELVAAVDKKGLAIVSGECPTVGFVGGYIQGGGHSVLSSRYGMGADQALEYEVITPSGELVIASPTENQDLFWALSGGGGGTYAIVWSVTIKAYPDLPTTIASLAFSAQELPLSTFTSALAAYQKTALNLTNAKIFTFAVYSMLGFQLDPIFAVGYSEEEVRDLVKPLLDTLDTLGIQYYWSSSNHPTYLSAFSAVPSFKNAEIANFQIGNRLLPRRLWAHSTSHGEEVNEEGINKLINTLVEEIMLKGGAVLDIAVRPTREVAGFPDNAVLPAWREAERTMGVIKMLDDRQSLESIFEDQRIITHEFAEALRKLAPEAGSYLNEASPAEPNPKHAFYGSNYAKLLSIKDKYDPDHLLYGKISVGGDRWAEDGVGRLCRVDATVVGRDGVLDRVRRYFGGGEL